MADRIETGTFCVAAALSKGDLEIQNLNNELEKFRKTISYEYTFNIRFTF